MRRVPVKSSRNFLGYPFSTYCKHSAITITIKLFRRLSDADLTSSLCADNRYGLHQDPD